MKELNHSDAVLVSRRVLLRACLLVAIVAVIAYFRGNETFMIGFSLGAVFSLLDWIFLYRRINTSAGLPFEQAIRHMQEGWFFRVLYLVLVLIGSRYLGVNMLALIIGLFLLHFTVMVDVGVTLFVKGRNGAEHDKERGE